MSQAEVTSSKTSNYNRILSQSARFANGWVRRSDSLTTITVSKTVRDVEDDKYRNFVQTYLPEKFSDDQLNKLYGWLGASTELLPAIFMDISPSGKKKLTARAGKDDIPILEVHTDDYTLDYKLDCSKVHGKIIGDTWFGGVSWSPDEKYVAYVASFKAPKRGTYFNEDVGEDSAGTQFEYVDDWGEKYTGISTLVISILELETSKITLITGPDENPLKWTIGQPTWSPFLNNSEGYRLAYTAWPVSGSRLGMIYCYQRPSSIFLTDLTQTLQSSTTSTPPPPLKSSSADTPHDLLAKATGQVPVGVGASSTSHVNLTPTIPLARSPRFAPDGKSLVFLGSDIPVLTHGISSQLFRTHLQQQGNEEGAVAVVPGNTEILVDVVNYTNTGVTEGVTDGIRRSFPGLYLDQLPRRCFLKSSGDGGAILTDSSWGVQRCLLLINLHQDGASAQNGSIPNGSIRRVPGLCQVLSDSEAYHIDDGLDDTFSYDRSDPDSLGCIEILDILADDTSADSQTAASGVAEDAGALVLFQASSPSRPQRLGLLRILDLGGGDYKYQLLRSAPLPPASIATLRAPAPAPATATPLGALGTSTSQQPTVTKPSLLSLQPPLATVTWRIVPITVPSLDTDSSSTLESVLLLPPLEGVSTPIPLVVMPHGGPHSHYTSAFIAAHNFVCLSLRSAVLLVNFRGSTGFGNNVLEALPGHIGDMDVTDVVTATEAVLQTSMSSVTGVGPEDVLLCDRSRVGVVGGSHGGFLAAHLIGQYPDLFKVAAMRNPVIDISTMLSTTDIPDWCLVEASAVGDRSLVGEAGFDAVKAVDAEVLKRLWDCSPIKYIQSVRAPVLLCLGALDRRVPPSQGLHYHKLLQARGIPTRLLIFPEDCHAIDKPKAEAEQWIAIAGWLEKYL